MWTLNYLDPPSMKSKCDMKRRLTSLVSDCFTGWSLNTNCCSLGQCFKLDTISCWNQEQHFSPIYIFHQLNLLKPICDVYQEARSLISRSNICVEGMPFFYTISWDKVLIKNYFNWILWTKKLSRITFIIHNKVYFNWIF